MYIDEVVAVGFNTLCYDAERCRGRRVLKTLRTNKFLDVILFLSYTLKHLLKKTAVFCLQLFFLANLAHLAEQHPRNVQVLGSSPRVGFF